MEFYKLKLIIINFATTFHSEYCFYLCLLPLLKVTTYFIYLLSSASILVVIIVTAVTAFEEFFEAFSAFKFHNIIIFKKLAITTHDLKKNHQLNSLKNNLLAFIIPHFIEIVLFRGMASKRINQIRKDLKKILSHIMHQRIYQN